MTPCPYCGRPDSFEPEPGWLAKDIALAAARLREMEAEKPVVDPIATARAEGYRAGAEATRREAEMWHRRAAHSERLWAMDLLLMGNETAALPHEESAKAHIEFADRILALPIPDAAPTPVAPAVDVAEVLAALEPVVREASAYDEEIADDERVHVCTYGHSPTPSEMTVGDFRALAALAAKLKETK